jgi:hypothetical protein
LGVDDTKKRGRAHPEGTNKNTLRGVVIVYSVREEGEEKRSKLLYKRTIAPRGDTRRGIIHDPYPPLQA